MKKHGEWVRRLIAIVLASLMVFCMLGESVGVVAELATPTDLTDNTDDLTGEEPEDNPGLPDSTEEVPQPEPTGTPEGTEVPQTTDAPEGTEVPQATDVPEKTEVPTETPVPQPVSLRLTDAATGVSVDAVMPAAEGMGEDSYALRVSLPTKVKGLKPAKGETLYAVEVTIVNAATGEAVVPETVTLRLPVPEEFTDYLYLYAQTAEGPVLMDNVPEDGAFVLDTLGVYALINHPEKTVSRKARSGGYTVTVSYSEFAGLEDTELSVRVIDRDEEPELYAEYVAMARKALGEDAVNSFTTLLVDVTFTREGVEVEPVLPVSIAVSRYTRKADELQDGPVVHFADDGIEVLDAVEEDGKVSFETGSLSFFMVPKALPADNTFSVSTAEEFQDAWNAIISEGNETDAYTIRLTADFEKAGRYTLQVKRDITILGDGHTITFGYAGGGTTGGFFLNHCGGTLTLKPGDGGLTLDGQYASNDDGGLLYVYDGYSSESAALGGTINMYGGVTLKNARTNNYIGAGVSVIGCKAVFNMYGGLIDNCAIIGGSNCYGGGVGISNGGTFHMSGGTISNCYVQSADGKSYACGGGVCLLNKGTLDITGGTISGCRAVASDSSAYPWGGGIYAANGSGGTINISNCTVSGCTTGSSRYSRGGGICIPSGSKDALIKNCKIDGQWSTKGYNAYYGGGIFNGSGSTKIVGGKVTGCLAVYGGGVCSYWAPITIGGDADGEGVEISSNYAYYYGGGICGYVATGLTVKNCKVSGNTAQNGGGGISVLFTAGAVIQSCTVSGNSAVQGAGVDLEGRSGYEPSALIESTSITGNTASYPDDTNNQWNLGGGIFYDEYAQLKLSGKDIISGNTYNGLPNNVAVLDAFFPVYIVGSLQGSQIGLSDPELWYNHDTCADTDDEAVSAAVLTSGYATYNSDAPETVFFSDHNTWYPERSSSTVNNSTGNEVRLMRRIWVEKAWDGYPSYQTYVGSEDKLPTTLSFCIDGDKDKTYELKLTSSYNQELGMWVSNGYAAYALEGGTAHSVEEVVPDGCGYTKTYEKLSDTYPNSDNNIDNTLTTWQQYRILAVTNTKDILVKKEWRDNDNQAQKRPEQLTIYLVRGEERIATGVMKPDADGKWAYSFSGQPWHDEDGKEISYTVEEESLPEYSPRVTRGSITSLTLVNTQVLTIKGTTVWDDADDQDHIRPGKVTIHLLADGKEKKTITVDATQDWNFVDM